MTNLNEIVSTLSSEDQQYFIMFLERKNTRSDTKNVQLFKLLIKNELNSTKKPRNNIQNLKIDTYFSIKPNDLYITHVYLPRIKHISPFQRYQLISKTFFLLFQDKSYSFYIFFCSL